MEIEKEVENFKDVIRADYKKWLDEKPLMEKDIRVYVDALYQGYLDACRTFKWSSESEVKKCKNDVDKREKIKRICKGEEPSGCAYQIREYLTKDNSIDFNEKHVELCKSLHENFKKNGVMVSYGQAQKIVNMAFKYLYCCKLDDKMRERFKACHMPLDSFSLEWFKRCFKEEDFFDKDYFTKLPDKLFKKVDGEKLLLKAESIGSWSSIKTLSENETEEIIRYPYEFYRDVIKKYCEEYNEKEVKREIYPLQLDFIVWPKMQKIMAAEAFIKTMEESEDEKEYEKNKLEKYDIKDSLNQVLKDRLNRIRDLIGEK